MTREMVPMQTGLLFNSGVKTNAFKIQFIMGSLKISASKLTANYNTCMLTALYFYVHTIHFIHYSIIKL